ncbi:MAG: transglycosylase SLT domain-containing protein, partial [candidate division Zixibacteria bacterium]|nr:transglycosylase SLT domain-containing protein [candidate division Zixibacteria bacterium]
MSAISPKVALTDFPSTGIERLKGVQAKGVEAEKARLRKATKEFESFFNYYMLKTMRKTIPKGESGQGLLSSDNSKDIFSDIFDNELARMMSGGRNGSIADMLYASMEKLIDAGYTQAEKKLPIKDLGAVRPSMDLGQPTFRKISGDPSPAKLKHEKSEPISLNRRPTEGARSTDEIMRKYGRHIEQAARVHALDPALLASVIRAESNGDANAVSPAGAKGLMQLIDSTAADQGVKRVFDPGENISGGARYLRQLLDRFGDTKLALAAYNAGPGNVIKYRGVPPFEETRSYVTKVLDSLQT